MKTLNRIAIFIFVPILGVAGYYLADIFLVDHDQVLMKISDNCNPFEASCTFTDPGLRVEVGFKNLDANRGTFLFKLVSEKPLDEVTIGFRNASISEGQSRPIPVPGQAAGRRWQMQIDLAENVREVEDWTMVMALTETGGLHFVEMPFFIRANKAE